ncbi:unnamed protein product [Triticum turgidum subsp. durum]|uniref:ACT domain-containing protein ACR n=1 Tax=Triticum turgidum subsp. durum TaxID=4567 RepID=A0A9R0S4Y8_TRITD|nr:unnamed protein product [Triticum turgidum subsp. durum]
MERCHPSEVYELFVRHMNTPRVVVDNGVCETATLVQVHSARKHGVLLEAVAALSDHGVCVRKGYISSDDGRWFMDVFHVTDAAGCKVADADKLLVRLESSLAAAAAAADALPRPAGCDSPAKEALCLLELIGVDRPGLLSEVFAVLHDLRCSTVDAKAWTHGGRVAALVFVRDEDTGAPIHDTARIRRIESRLRHVLRGGARGARTVLLDAAAVGNLDRRLHQLLSEDREADRRAPAEGPATTATAVAVQEWGERGYSVVTVSCRDRPKLLFDVVCTLTDLDYVVYHGTFDTDGDHAQQEFYIRRLDGRAAGLRDARVPGEQPLGHARRDHHPGRHGRERLPRHRRGRPPRRPQDHRRGHPRRRHREPPGGRGAMAPPLLHGGRRRRRRGRRPVLARQPGEEEPLQPRPHQILLLKGRRRRTRVGRDGTGCLCEYGTVQGLVCKLSRPSFSFLGLEVTCTWQTRGGCWWVVCVRMFRLRASRRIDRCK